MQLNNNPFLPTPNELYVIENAEKLFLSSVYKPTTAFDLRYGVLKYFSWPPEDMCNLDISGGTWSATTHR